MKIKPKHFWWSANRRFIADIETCAKSKFTGHKKWRSTTSLLGIASTYYSSLQDNPDADGLEVSMGMKVRVTRAE
jgi:hypothetical protein